MTGFGDHDRHIGQVSGSRCESCGFFLPACFKQRYRSFLAMHLLLLCRSLTCAKRSATSSTNELLS